MAEKLTIYRLAGFIMILSAFPAINLNHSLLPYPAALFVLGVIVLELDNLIEEVQSLSKRN